MQSQLELFPNPVEPTAPQLRDLLAYLRAGNTITMKEALLKLGIGALSQRVGDLKDLHWPIKSKMIWVGEKHVGGYFMGQE